MAGTGVGKFSSTAGSNTANMTVNFAENMAPSNVNNAARELMGHMRDMYEQLGDGYFEYGDGDGTYTVARGDADTITITSASDISSVYFAGRKIRIVDGGSNTVEGTIASSSHSSTTQTVNLTGITLASGTPTKVEIGIDTAAFGGRVILDDDSDTYIEAPTDDTIDIYVAGAKDFVITANTFTAESGSTIAAQALTATSIDATAASTITVTDNSDALTLKTTDTDSNVGPVLNFNRDSSSPANNDFLGELTFQGDNDAGEAHDYIRMFARILNVADGSEQADFIMKDATGNNIVNFAHSEVVYNEDSVDRDFRVESNSNTHMLFVDGGTDTVCINTSSTAFNSEADDLIIGSGTGDTGITIFSGSSVGNCGSIFFADGASDGPDHQGQIQYEQNTEAFHFHTNRTKQWSLNSSGNWLPAATDHGIYLGVTSATAANLLDDYEEGAWTPTIAADAGPGGYTTQNGNYTKVGRLVNLCFQLQVSSMGSLAGAALVMSGLPFTASNDSMDYVGTLNVDGAASDWDYDIGIIIAGNNATMKPQQNWGDDSTDHNVNADRIDTGTKLHGSISYMV